MSGSVREARTPFRRPTNVSLDASLIDEAKALGINVSRACEEGLAKQIASARRTRWMAENAEAMAASNAYVAEYGLPLEKYRLF